MDGEEVQRYTGGEEKMLKFKRIYMARRTGTTQALLFGWVFFMVTFFLVFFVGFCFLEGRGSYAKYVRTH